MVAERWNCPPPPPPKGKLTHLGRYPTDEERAAAKKRAAAPEGGQMSPVVDVEVDKDGNCRVSVAGDISPTSFTIDYDAGREAVVALTFKAAVNPPKPVE